MNKSIIKAYAPEARKEYIRAVTARAHVLGFSASSSKTMQATGDIASIGTIVNGTFVAEQVFPAIFAKGWREVELAIQHKGFEQVMEEIAFTWFNRLIALRYMELHDYLPCKTMILGNRSEGTGVQRPAIMEELDDIDQDTIPKVDWAKILELRLEGGRDEQIYRHLLIGQCNSLSSAMPLMFKRLSYACELLLPDNLLHSGSLIQTLVQSIPAEEWDTVEIVGWLYQFYISEKKEQVIGKTVKTEDIPAATQLFTPNWIVQYMVQNTVGRQWLSHNPYSTLKSAMPYYITPAEQDTPDATPTLPTGATPTTLLKPEDITFLDPACGSGHILVEAYNVFMRMYQEKGHPLRKIPRLILQNNLFGLDIDERAAQLTQFALLMMAMQKDSRILENPPTMHIMALQEWEDEELIEAPSADNSYETMPLFAAVAKPAPASRRHKLAQDLLRPRGKQTSDQGSLIPIGAEASSEDAPLVTQEELFALLDLFCHAKTFGSLLRVPASLKAALPRFAMLIEQAAQCSVTEQDAAATLAPFVRQAEYLAKEYDCVVANPPYMGGKGLNAQLKNFLADNYADVKSDLFSAFIIRDFSLTKAGGQLGFMSPFVWMFISSYEKLRTFIIEQKCITSLIQLEYSGFDGATVPVCTYTFQNSKFPQYKGSYIRLSDFRGADNQAPKTLEAIQNPKCGWFYHASASDFAKIPSTPLAYWVSDAVRDLFNTQKIFDDDFYIKAGICTGENAKFILLWHEINFNMLYSNNKKGKYLYVPHNKGGNFRKWLGNWDTILKYSDKHIQEMEKGIGFRHDGKEFYFTQHIGWSKITSSLSSFRLYPSTFSFDSAGLAMLPKDNNNLYEALSFLNSKISARLIALLNPTLNVTPQIIKKLPLPTYTQQNIPICESLCNISRTDWDSYETSWDFTTLPLLRPEHHKDTLAETYTTLRSHWQTMTDSMQSLEEENNQIFIDAYGLQDELTKDVPLKEITLTCNPYYRYGESAENISDDGKAKVEKRLFDDSMKELLSYAIGCMMGRYSLDSEGLAYAGAGNVDFDKNKYPSFAADDDGIIPVTDMLWFEDDAARRFTSFMTKTWGKDNLQANMTTVASALEPKVNESPETTIRRYLSTKFFKNQHCTTYKKRPIYWLFSSGKYKAFECLVYMHRYTSATLSRMRAEYVTPLQGKINSRIDYLETELENATGKNALSKELTAMQHKQDELRAFDDLLRHYAEMRIELDLDDGVKKNYARFGALLADVKAIAGGKDD